MPTCPPPTFWQRVTSWLSGAVADWGGKVPLKESAIDIYGQLGYLDPRDLWFNPTDGTAPAAPGWVPPYYYQSQKKGEVIPVFINEHQLRFLRDRSRILCANNEFAICGIENRANYIAGTGFTYRIIGPKQLSGPAQKVIDAWQEVNDLGGLEGMEAETLKRMDTDGEAFIRLFPMGDGLVRLRFIEPEHIRTPFGTGYTAKHSFGIETEESDVEDVKGYWVVEEPIRTPAPSFVPADEVVHFKLNVYRSGKRGLPTFYPVEQNLKRCEDLLASMTSMAKARAKIAAVWELSGVSATNAAALRDKLTDARVTDPTTGNEINIERWRYGTVMRVPANQKLTFPAASTAAAELVEILQAELRGVSVRLQMPEWMFTGLADQKYSNAFVTEGPTLKAFQRLQNGLARKWGECRYKGRQSLAWRQLKHAVAVGLLSPETLRECKVQCKGPSLESRDKSGEAQANKAYLDMRVKSRQTVQSEMGLDPEKEDAQIAADPYTDQQQSDQTGNAAQLGGDPFAVTESLLEECGCGGACGRCKGLKEVKDRLGRCHDDQGHLVPCGSDGGKSDPLAKGSDFSQRSASDKVANIGRGKTADKAVDLAVGVAAKVGGAVAKAEHAIKDQIGKAVDRLPPKVGRVVRSVWGVMVSTYSIGYEAVKEVAAEKGLLKGMSPEEAQAAAEKVATAVSTIDVILAKPTYLAAEIAHLGLPVGTALSMVPIASAAYLGVSGVRHPIRTAKAAARAVRTVWGRIKSGQKAATHESEENPTGFSREAVAVILDRFADIKDEGGREWYFALLMAATAHAPDLMTAAEIAGKAFDDQPNLQEEFIQKTDKRGYTICRDNGRPVACPDAAPDSERPKGRSSRRTAGQLMAASSQSPEKAARAVRELAGKRIYRDDNERVEAMGSAMLGHEWNMRRPGYDTAGELGDSAVLLDIKQRTQAGIGYQEGKRSRLAKAKHYLAARSSGPALNGVVFVTDEGVFLHVGVDPTNPSPRFGPKGTRGGIVEPDQLSDHIDGAGGSLPAVRLSSSIKGAKGLAQATPEQVSEVRENVRKTLEGIVANDKTQNHLDAQADQVARLAGREGADIPAFVEGVLEAATTATLIQAASKLAPEQRQALIQALQQANAGQ